FFVLEGKSPRPAALFSGGLLTLASIVTFQVSISPAGRSRPLSALTTQSRTQSSELPVASRQTAPRSTENPRENTRSPGQSAVAAVDSRPDDTKTAAASNAVTTENSGSSDSQPFHPQSTQLQASESPDATNTTRGVRNVTTINEMER